MQARRLLAAAVIAAVAAMGGSAFAHRDPNPDSTRCDKWYRPGHTSTTAPTDSHHHTDPADVNANDPVNHTYVHQHGGHYVVRGDYGYVEVVGGQSYSRPFGDPNGAQGGFVQGEIDPIAGGPDVDFHASVFSGAGKPNPTYLEKNVCVSAANRVVESWDCPNPPKPSGTCR